MEQEHVKMCLVEQTFHVRNQELESGDGE